MASPDDVATLERTLRDIVAVAYRELVERWGELIADAPGPSTGALAAHLPDLVERYADAASAVAADWYDDLREAAGAPGRYRAVVADPPPVEQVEATARWAAGPLWAAEPDDRRALQLVAGAMQRLIAQGARDTIATNVERDQQSGVRWARMPRGPSPCAFCRMVASRGAVYRSYRTAAYRRRTQAKYHDRCWCIPVPVWPGQTEPYDVNRYRQEYVNARAEAASGEPREILRSMREQLGVN